MSRGGARPGAGRPRKPTPPAVEISTPAGAPLTPLALLESVMADERQDIALRVSCARALLPYTCPKPARLGSKAAREIEALDCERGSRWEALLAAPALPPEADTPRRDDGSPDWDKLLS